MFQIYTELFQLRAKHHLISTFRLTFMDDNALHCDFSHNYTVVAAFTLPSHTLQPGRSRAVIHSRTPCIYPAINVIHRKGKNPGKAWRFLYDWNAAQRISDRIDLRRPTGTSNTVYMWWRKLLRH